ncbi:Dps family protein [Clostridium aminobutyricum]|uniref:DNA starvation/stationary phase protection protein n=1 Tax=Clostridium aminobutyricum TaxID=33953 RepID=A0A939IJD6_CLOAM|nr:DNA starvation/stationary phase protection protein [Clostridium aminobutyricum]MBN7773503.1 DNA starvation/stationary phase protection protein [Clostridium aminobutyricum]
MNLINKLNIFLADQQIFYVKLHNLHWYLAGSSFFTLHAKFEELYNQTATVADDVAERILALGGKPIGSVKKALEVSGVRELDDTKIAGQEAVNVLLADVKAFNEASKEIRGLAGEAGDGVTEDQFNGYVGAYEKLIWMLEAYLEK